MQRRDFFQGSAVATAAALGGCGSPMSMQQQRTPFSVPATFIPVAGSDEMFPVRRIYCIGRNYAAHAREMGSDPNREPPFFFQKPTDAIQFVALGTTPDHPYPPLTKNYHYEAELVAAIGKGGRNIPVASALEHIWGYTLGLDMTRRDLQRAMGDEKKPWEIGKSFDRSAPFGGAALGGANRPLHQGSDMAQSQRPAQAERQSQPDDLVGGRAGIQAL
jgi:fumarylpyruvate hydrolase